MCLIIISIFVCVLIVSTHESRMFKMYKNLLFIFFTFCSISGFAGDIADRVSKFGRWSFVGSTGLTRYDGDIDPMFETKGILRSPNLDFSLEYNLHPSLSFGFSLGGMMIDQEDSNEFFLTKAVYTTTFASVDLVSVLSGKPGKRWSVNTSVGLGLAGMILPEYTTTRNDATDPAKGMVIPPAFFITPVNLNLEYKISKRVNIGLNVRHYYANSDHLESMHRGDYRDTWQNLNLSLRYKFVTKENKHFRDEVFDYREEASLAIINKLQQEVNSLAVRMGDAESKIENLGDRMVVVEGILANDGPDTDKDGVPDVRDLEPNTDPGTPVDFWGRGLSVKAVKADELLSVYFDFDSIELDKIAQITLVKIAEKMRNDASLMLEIRGYTDNLGTSVYNQRLSQRRAERVKQELQKVYGIPHNRMVANGKGKIPDPPVKTLMNRRCDFFFSK